jgi:hypothetical protein
MSEIVIYGSGGHGISTLSLINSIGGYTVLGFIDDSRSKGEHVALDLQTLGDYSTLLKMPRNVNVAIGIGVALLVKVHKSTREPLCAAVPELVLE